MNARDAAEYVLAQVGEPLSYHDSTRHILDADLWETNGQTPEATINAQLSMDIVTLRSASRFQRTARGIFALRRWGLPEYVGTPQRSGMRDSNVAATEHDKTLPSMAQAPQISSAPLSGASAKFMLS